MFVLQALLEQQLAVERGKMETEKKKFQHAMDEKVKFHLLYCMIPLHTQKMVVILFLVHLIVSLPGDSLIACLHQFPQYFFIWQK